MIVDVVAWSDDDAGCSRCSRPGPRYIVPYWDPTKRLCPKCCTELATLYDAQGWPRR